MNQPRRPIILPPPQRWRVLLSALALVLLLLPLPAAALPVAALPLAPLPSSGLTAPSPLETRLARWPSWRLPAPLPRPGDRAPAWPDWFAGEWLVHSVTVEQGGETTGREDPPWRARFVLDGRGRVVADRAFNAGSLGHALLGSGLSDVRDDPRHPQRQLSRFRDGRLLETTLVGSRSELDAESCFLNDELSLQVLHGEGDPQLSRVETLGRWQRRADGGIEGEQWQAGYRSPGEGLVAEAEWTARIRLSLDPLPSGSDPATETGA